MLGTRVCGSRFRNGREIWNVPVVFETSDTLAVLDRCSGVGPLDLSKSL